MIYDFNNIQIIGRFVQSPELTYTPNGNAVCKFSIANNYGDDAYFFNCESWKLTAENIAKFFKKGDKVLLEGKLKQDTWESEGKKRSAVKIVVFKFHFIGGNKKSNVEKVKDAFQADDNIPY
jgi:single-strand DNA-binding protein